MIFTRQLLTLAGAEGEVLEQAIRYLRIVFCGSLFINLGQSTNMIMRGEGKLKKAMIIMATSAILNIILDPILIKVLGEGNGVLGALWFSRQFFTTQQQNGAAVNGRQFWVQPSSRPVLQCSV